MKCANCGREFGTGTHCQYCGVDRVTGLANFGSYGTSDYQGAKTSHYDSSYNSSPKTMVCYACSEIIPSDSEYCPHCRKKLFETCPNCGHRYSSQYSNCNQCGTNRKEYYEQKEKERRAELERQKKEQEERVKKEQEQIISKEAIKLKDELGSSNMGCVILGTMVLIGAILSCTLFASHSIYDTPENYIANIVLDIIRGGFFGFLGGGIIGYAIIGPIRRNKFNQWKQEHPNDPRSKYL